MFFSNGSRSLNGIIYLNGIIKMEEKISVKGGRVREKFRIKRVVCRSPNGCAST